jgi:hypothetical protein
MGNPYGRKTKKKTDEIDYATPSLNPPSSYSTIHAVPLSNSINSFKKYSYHRSYQFRIEIFIVRAPPPSSHRQQLTPHSYDLHTRSHRPIQSILPKYTSYHRPQQFCIKKFYCPCPVAIVAQSTTNTPPLVYRSRVTTAGFHSPVINYH